MEFLDELVFGAWAAAWPLIRTDLHLSYVQVGVLLSAPALLANAVEPVFGVLGDARDRRRLVRLGGAAFAAGLLAVALSPAFLPLLLALVLLYPAAGVFVGLSQAALMDLDPRAHELNMARWALAGSAGVVAGPVLLAAAAAAGTGWRGTFVLCAAAAALLLAALRLAPAQEPPRVEAPAPLGAALRRGARDALAALRRREVLRWLALLECADLLLDVLHGFLALYFVDVAGLSGAQAVGVVAVWTGVGLLGDALLIPLLRRVDGLRYLRASALAILFLFPAFLLVQPVAAKVALLGALGLLNSGWYAILQGRLYSAMPGRSATVLALGSVSGMVGGLLPLALAGVAERYGLSAAMWTIAAAPVALLAGLPRGGGRRRGAGGSEGSGRRDAGPDPAGYAASEPLS